MKKHFVTELYFDQQTEHALRAAWEAFAAEGYSSVMVEHGGRPHITLSSSEPFDVQAHEALLKNARRELASFQVDLSFIGLFPGKTEVLFLGIAASSKLRMLQEKVVQTLLDASIKLMPFSTIDKAVLHTTLVTDLKPKQGESALQFAKTLKLPTSGKVEEIGLVEYSPARQIYGFSLKK